SGTGMVVAHHYNNVGTYVVTLTVTDALGRAVSATKTCTITALAAPKADFTFSPTEPVPNVQMYFNAATSTVAAGRRIVSYQWNWGDGSQSPERTGPTEDHTYTAEATYTVTLTIVDDIGRRSSVSKTVTVKS
ncbi:MAG: PKD domain-containing protein, partial [Acidobacteria bacterium]